MPAAGEGIGVRAGGRLHRASGSVENAVLSDVLRAVRLTGGVFFSIEATAPWALEGPASDTIGPFIRPGVEHILQFHAIASGTCWGGLLEEARTQLDPGDVILLPQGVRHRLSSAPGLIGGPVSVRLDPAARISVPRPFSGGQGRLSSRPRLWRRAPGDLAPPAGVVSGRRCFPPPVALEAGLRPPTGTAIVDGGAGPVSASDRRK